MRFFQFDRAATGNDRLLIRPHRIADIALGISILGWATVGTWSNLGLRPLSVLIATSLLHFMVGVLFLLRTEAKLHGNLTSCLIAVPAVLLGGWVFRFAPSDWNLPSQILFFTGSGLAVLSFAFLGRCFAILPAVRGTVTRGPFAYIRHPAYLGEFGMVVASMIAVPMHWSSPLVLILAFTLFVVRVRVEERLLLTGDEYQRYCRRVRWRLLPFVW
jgi:protein-S-isoprenylcysteine O-methyltransferase Ste14